MNPVRSVSWTRSISRRPLVSNKQSSTRSACSEYRAKLTPAPSQVAPSGCGRPLRTVLGVTTARAGASTAPSLRGKSPDRLREVAAVRLPAAVALALHRVIGEPDETRAVGDLHLLHDIPDHDQP